MKGSQRLVALDGRGRIVGWLRTGETRRFTSAIARIVPLDRLKNERAPAEKETR
jgi:hypothetical protein